MLDTYSYPLKCFWTFIGLKLIWSVKVKVLVTKSCPTLCYHGLQPAGLFCPWNSTVKNTGMGYHSLLQGIFPIQGSNQGPHIRGRFFTIWASRDGPNLTYIYIYIYVLYICYIYISVILYIYTYILVIYISVILYVYTYILVIYISLIFIFFT